jgi:hypothetical protein
MKKTTLKNRKKAALYTVLFNADGSADTNVIRYAQRMVTTEQKWWITVNPVGTLSELLALLESVRDECDCFNEEDVIADYADDLSCDAVVYFSAWGNLSELVDGEMPATFAYRRDNLDEDIRFVEELYDSLGGDVVVADLAAMPECAAC